MEEKRESAAFKYKVRYYLSLMAKMDPNKSPHEVLVTSDRPLEGEDLRLATIKAHQTKSGGDVLRTKMEQDSLEILSSELVEN